MFVDAQELTNSETGKVPSREGTAVGPYTGTFLSLISHTRRGSLRIILSFLPYPERLFAQRFPCSPIPREALCAEVSPSLPHTQGGSLRRGFPLSHPGRHIQRCTPLIHTQGGIYSSVHTPYTQGGIYSMVPSHTHRGGIYTQRGSREPPFDINSRLGRLSGASLSLFPLREALGSLSSVLFPLKEVLGSLFLTVFLTDVHIYQLSAQKMGPRGTEVGSREPTFPVSLLASC